MGIRNIIFRGKTSNGEWVEGFYVCNRYSIGFAKEPVIYENHYIYTKRIDGEKWFKTIQVEVIPETVGQFTGLTDKNGTKIFEGDIVRVKGKETEENWKDYDEFGKVVFENGAFLIKVANIFNGKKYFSEVHSRYMTTADWVEREVVGNVFENKELIGENK